MHRAIKQILLFPNTNAASVVTDTIFWKKNVFSESYAEKKR
jgi:hypothetical protein